MSSSEFGEKNLGFEAEVGHKIYYFQWNSIKPCLQYFTYEKHDRNGMSSSNPIELESVTDKVM